MVIQQFIIAIIIYNKQNNICNNNLQQYNICNNNTTIYYCNNNLQQTK